MLSTSHMSLERRSLLTLATEIDRLEHSPTCDELIAADDRVNPSLVNDLVGICFIIHLDVACSSSSYRFYRRVVCEAKQAGRDELPNEHMEKLISSEKHFFYLQSINRLAHLGHGVRREALLLS